ncbi:MAG: hypothetical protein NT062_35120 [Proteobacteria bacterium]|nr:hypothetical protein [Pseudomonadota bacterium]
MRASLLLLLGSSLLAACSTTDPGSAPNPYGEGTPDNPVPSTTTGPYQVVNTIDFTTEAILPAQGELIVSTLREFSTNPAHALIDIADQAGVPAVGALYGVIPGVIKDRIEGWINDELDKVRINGQPLTAYTAEVVSYFDIALTQFAVDSELDLSGTQVTHRITALDLRPAGVDLRIPIGGLAGDLLTQNPTLEVGAGGALTFGEQHFGLNYGEYAWQGIEALSTAAFGAGVRATLGAAVNCQNLAHAVADKCVLGVCVGHETELTGVCEGGLDAIVNFAHDRLAAMRLEALHLGSGTARLVDVDGDGVGDQIVDGAWTAEMNLGLGLRHTPARFEGSR